MAPENDAVSTFPEALVSHNAQGNLSLSRLLEAHFEYTIKSYFFKTLYVNPSFGQKVNPFADFDGVHLRVCKTPSGYCFLGFWADLKSGFQRKMGGFVLWDSDGFEVLVLQLSDFE